MGGQGRLNHPLLLHTIAHTSFKMRVFTWAWPTDQQTDERTNKVFYIVASTRLKKIWAISAPSVNNQFLLLSSGHIFDSADVSPRIGLRLWDICGKREWQRHRRHHQSFRPQTRQFSSAHHRYDQYARVWDRRCRLMNDMSAWEKWYWWLKM